MRTSLSDMNQIVAVTVTLRPGDVLGYDRTERPVQRQSRWIPERQHSPDCGTPREAGRNYIAQVPHEYDVTTQPSNSGNSGVPRVIW
jgi:hypothetical protein